MFGSRRGRPSLIGRAAHTAARTAVIAGTANAVTGRQMGRQASRAAAAAPIDPVAPQPAAPAAQDIAAGPQALDEAGIARLRSLAELHQAGILSDEDFAEQKARLLA